MEGLRRTSLRTMLSAASTSPESPPPPSPNFFHQGLKDRHPISVSPPLKVKVIGAVVLAIFLAIAALLCYLSCRYPRLVQRPPVDLETRRGSGDATAAATAATETATSTGARTAAEEAAT
ncbi:hypothetical protein QJS04_geneDACA012457 [Acorus gramineus]|uniref:Uncharacterized protein n=1 Tax=Acorus gramineus TaxID=55184 RepID=A0AAV9BA18_ACOGR|nr:hypothetical protein QJS04_geneDACA012457 [Acorus gramineus]